MDFITDFFNIIDDKCKIFIFSQSKIEHAVSQLFSGFKLNPIFDVDSLEYTIVKAINTYKPKEVLQNISTIDSDKLIASLKDFLINRIEINKQDLELERNENKAFQQVVDILD